jgi:hypothetical protein
MNEVKKDAIPSSFDPIHKNSPFGPMPAIAAWHNSNGLFGGIGMGLGYLLNLALFLSSLGKLCSGYGGLRMHIFVVDQIKDGMWMWMTWHWIV